MLWMWQNIQEHSSGQLPRWKEWSWSVWGVDRRSELMNRYTFNISDWSLRVDRALNGGGKETETWRTKGKNGGKTRQKSRGRSTREQSQWSPSAQSRKGPPLMSLWQTSSLILRKDLNKIKEDMRLKEALKEAEAKKRGIYIVLKIFWWFVHTSFRKNWRCKG